MTIPISAYEPFFSDKQQKLCPGGKPYEYEFYQFMEEIKSGAHREVIEQVRAIEEKNARSAYKAQNLLAVTISAICHTWRKESNIAGHTGLMGIDIDPDDIEIDDWGALRDNIADRLPVVAAALSASGRGLFFVIKVPRELSLHRDIYTYVSWKIQEVFGLRVDPTGKNPDRLRFTSYDPDCYINYNIAELPEIVPDAEYWRIQAEQTAINIPMLSSSGPDSINVYRNGIAIAQTARKHRPAYEFKDGEKHPFLVVVASHCNARGMSEDRCKQLTRRLYASQTNIPDEELCRPIGNVYKTYAKEFGRFPVPPLPFVSIKHKRWLLSKVDKQYLRSRLYSFGATTIHGTSGRVVRVTSTLLVFLMALFDPKYTWTTDECPAELLSNEQCASVFRPDCKIGYGPDGVVFLEKDYGYPKDWDE